MVLPRALYNDVPPERRSRISNNPTLLYSWWCTIFSAVIIGLRLAGRYIRNDRFFREDKMMALSIVPLLARMSLVHIVLIYGTNNADVADLDDAFRLHRRETGAKVVLAARIFYAMFIWMAKFTVSEFLKRMTERFWKKGYEFGLRAIRFFLVVTFIGVVVATLTECHPFHHYWQVKPDPGPRCRQGYAHLFTMGITDIATDVLLICFPIPILMRSGMPIVRKLSLVALFSMSVILIVITGARIPLVVERRGLQQFRTVFASSEILAATVVSNAIILGSFLRDRGVKKAKYRAGSTNDSMDRRPSTRRQTLEQCGSDEDLARSLGFRTNPDLKEEEPGVARPAQVVDLNLLSPPKHLPPPLPPPFSNSSWEFPKRQAATSCSSDRIEDVDKISMEPMPSPRGLGRRVSFFDVGGLLEGGHPAANPSPTDSVQAQDFAAQNGRPARASTSYTMSARASGRRCSRLSQQSDEHEMHARLGPQGLDPGRLSEQDELAVDGGLSRTTSPSSPTSAFRASPTSPRHMLSPHSPRRAVESRRPSSPALHDAGGLLPSQ